MLVRVFFSTRYSVDDPRSDARSSPSSATLRPRYSVSSAATEPSRRPLMASTSATLLAFGTASPPQQKTDGPGPSDWRMPRVEAPLEVLACAGALTGLRAMRQPDGLRQGRTVAQGAAGGLWITASNLAAVSLCCSQAPCCH